MLQLCCTRAAALSAACGLMALQLAHALSFEYAGLFSLQGRERYSVEISTVGGGTFDGDNCAFMIFPAPSADKEGLELAEEEVYASEFRAVVTCQRLLLQIRRLPRLIRCQVKGGVFAQYCRHDRHLHEVEYVASIASDAAADVARRLPQTHVHVRDG